MSAIITAFVIILVLISAVLVIWILSLIYWKTKKYEDAPIIINFMSQYSDYRAYGPQTSVVNGKDERVIIHYLPQDIYPKNLDTIKEVEAIVDKNKIVELPKGNCFSKERNVRILLPPDPSMLNEGFKKSDLGKIFMFYISLQNANRTEIEAYREGMLRQNAHIKELGMGEASVERIKSFEGLMDDLLKTVIKAKSDGKSNQPGFSQITSGGS